MSAWNSAHWAWPQITVLSLTAFNLVGAALRNGQPKSNNTYNFPISLCSAAISLWIMWSGGFFA